MSKQTALQWYIQQHDELAELSRNKTITISEILIRIKDIKKQALKMEREQIIDAYNNGDLRSADLYYKETYGDHSVDDNKMIYHIADVRKMVGGQDE